MKWSDERHPGHRPGASAVAAAAKAVSGSHVSGPAFFGLWKPKELAE